MTDTRLGYRGRVDPAVVTRRKFVERSIAIGLGAAALPSLLEACRAVPTMAGTARFTRSGSRFSLGNDAIRATWSVEGGRFQPVAVSAPGLPGPLRPAESFRVILADGRTVSASEMAVVDQPATHAIAAKSEAARTVERVGGREVVLRLDAPDAGFRVTWRGILRNGSHYVRQSVTLESTGGDVRIGEIVLVDVELPHAKVSGAVKGSPIVGGRWFVGFEHPLSESAADDEHAVALLRRELPLRAGTAPEYSSVIGVTPEGQLRRSFLAYVERERAHPYRAFLHYNSWYDLGYFGPYDEAGALGAIRSYGEALHVKRGVSLDSFLFDDGWDDPKSLWHFNSGFPNGFTPLRDAAARYGAAPGVWMSPWGGYGKPRQERVAYGQAQGFETVGTGFALSGPRYFQRFRETCLTMIREYGVNQFKFDGTGNANRVVTGSEFDSDFDAMIRLIGDLRVEKPDLYVNLTTGTYPSPFFLRYADSIWRGGSDHDFAGVGTKRQQWITYRDADTHRGIVQKGPLFPLNSLMLHGLIYARFAEGLDSDPGNDFSSEIRAYFGSGTQLQEMYVTPAFLSEENWDVLAAAAKWSRAHADVLVDTHWVGGDPAALEPYGWAAWRDGRATLVLRNPKEEPQSIAIEPAAAFELPSDARERYEMRSPWPEDAARPAVSLDAGTPHTFELQPFEVVTLETDAGA